MDAPRAPRPADVLLATGGILAAALALALFLVPLPGAFGPLFGADGNDLARTLDDARTWSSLRFALLESLASSGLALALGLPAAWLVARREFRGRRLLSSLASVPFAVPPLLVALGFVMFWGRSGAVNASLVRVFDLDEPPLGFLYSFHGVVLAHAVYNFPIVMRLAGDLWARLPDAQADAARSLGAGEGRILLGVTLPQLAPALASAASLVFLYSFSSFVIVLVFGAMAGSTVEVEIYRAARIEVDPGRAASLALVGTAAVLLLVGAYAAIEARHARAGQAPGLRNQRKPLRGRLERSAAAAYGLVVAVLVGGPALSVLVASFIERRGFSGAFRLGFGNYLRLFELGALGSLGATLALALMTAFIASATGTAAAWGLRALGVRGPALAFAYLPLAVSPAVIALGWTRIVPGRGGASLLAVALVQAAGAWPLAWRSAHAAFAKIQGNVRAAAATLGSSTADRARRVDIPLAARGIASGAAFAFALSVGDAGSLILASTGGVPPLALLMYRLAGSYRFNEACAAGVLMALLGSLAFAVREEAADAL